MESLPARHILVSVDESKASSRAFDWALDNIVREGDKVHLLHVIPPGQYVVMSTGLVIDEVMEDNGETQQKVEEHARQYLTSTFAPRLEARQLQYQIEIVKFATDNDSIGAIICKRADQLSAATVVLAKHNKGQLKEFFVGSVTNYCTHHCRSPVLVMHAD